MLPGRPDGGERLVLPAGGDADGQPVYWRKESPTQTPEDARMQEASGEVWGRAPRDGAFPAVQAYRGHLPHGVRGIEFTTPVRPDPGSPPGIAYWRGPRPGVRVEGEFAKLEAVVVTRNAQR